MFRRPPFALALLVFLLTAALGLGLAYAPGPAAEKFAWLAGAALLYGLLAGWPAPRPDRLLAALIGLGAAVAGYFLLTHNWLTQPADFALLNRLGAAWMRARPAVPGYLHPNAAGGLLAALLPFALALGWRALRGRRWALVGWAAAGGGVIGVGLLFTSSRGAWLALAGGLGIGAAMAAAGRLPARWRPLFARLGLALAGGLLLGGAGLLWRSPERVVAIADGLPGLASGASRWELNVNSFQLAEDFWLTGGGLRAFEGLYSRYARLIQVPQFTYSHNFYLDVWLEQGLAGLAALGVLYLGAAARLVRARDLEASLRWPALAGLLVVLAHGLLDDALYGNAGTPWLFLLPGAAAALTQARVPPLRLGRAGRLGLAGLGLLAAGWLATPAARAGGWANLGAALLARAELAAWPAQVRAGAAPPAAAASLQRALALDPANRTAALRLGLLAEARGDYAAAAVLLEPAQAAGLRLPAYRKALGYAYLWTGRPAQAEPLLATLTEAPMELFEYARWWRAQGRPDLAAQADALRAALAAR